jgi:hypothetical protein
MPLFKEVRMVEELEGSRMDDDGNQAGNDLRPRRDLIFVGWDVGGWNCDNNPSSRDAIVILDSELTMLGKAWRGNLRDCLNQSASTKELIRNLLSLCAAHPSPEPVQVTLAIDTPLGFSDEFVGLVGGARYTEPEESSETNRYLYRQAERYLFEMGLKPLSPIKDMIGSQATKGMHAVAKFAPIVQRCGVWSDGEVLTAIEAYPSACKRSGLIQSLRQRVGNQPRKDQDEMDALTCALVAYLFANRPEELIPPPGPTPASEGWIWIPKDIL